MNDDVSDDDILDILKDWMKFSRDVVPNDAAGADWLNCLKDKTFDAIDKLRGPEIRSCRTCAHAIYGACDHMNPACTRCDGERHYRAKPDSDWR